VSETIPASVELPLPTPHAVLFDVDYTLLRPNEMFHAEGYRAMGEKFGLTLDVERWDEAEKAAYAVVKARRAELGPAHDQGVYEAIAGAVITGMGGGPDDVVQRCAEAVILEWTRCENFTLYDDVKPCLERLRAAAIGIGLVSNTNRDLGDVLEHFYLDAFIDVAVTSLEVGFFKPAPQIYQAVLDRMGVSIADAVMVGDSYEDDVAGAMRGGLAAILLDRDGRRTLPVPTIRSLAELPAALSL
jgi:HAD superfamily hydrolase (TIGR01509 family)